MLSYIFNNLDLVRAGVPKDKIVLGFKSDKIYFSVKLTHQLLPLNVHLLVQYSQEDILGLEEWD
jgi:hypothetical protein